MNALFCLPITFNKIDKMNLENGAVINQHKIIAVGKGGMGEFFG